MLHALSQTPSVFPSASLQLGWLDVFFGLKNSDAVAVNNPAILRIEEEADAAPLHFDRPALEVLIPHGCIAPVQTQISMLRRP
jgi:hypothetical protein